MTTPLLTQRGLFVYVTYEHRTLPAFVALASDNGYSAVLLFDGMLGGYAGSMPVAWSEARGAYVDLLVGHPLVVTLKEEHDTCD